MKKMYLIGALMLMGVGAALISCDSIANGCKCTVTANVAGIEVTTTTEFTKDEVKAADVNTCSGLAAKIKKEAKDAAGGELPSGYSVSCKSR